MRIVRVLLLFSVFLLPSHFSSYLCINSSASNGCLAYDGTEKCLLKFCSYNASACCDSAKGMHLQQLFQTFNISNIACASLQKSVLCAICDQIFAELFKGESGLRNVSAQGSFTFLERSSRSQDNSSTEFCMKVWDTCENISILNSPFASSKKGRAGKQMCPSCSKLMDEWQLKKGFCEALVRSLDTGELPFCDESVSHSKVEAPRPVDGLCLEKIGNGAYINMVPHPDGSNHVFLSNQQGKTWLANVPDEGSNGILGIVESEPFLDLTKEVAFDIGVGLISMAFHPNFVNNGRFFMSFNCDKMKQPGCVGRCSCNTDVDCDPAKLGADNGVQPCQYHSIVAEYTANDTSSKPSLAKRANSAEVTRILTLGLPYSSGHAGQILFGPADGYLYLMIADGVTEINELGLWGNYSIPKDNPYIADKELEPEIWALGFHNPWRCSFDSERPSYFICGEPGQDHYEEVDIIRKGGNYGWRVYEGPLLFHPAPAESPGGNTSISSINPIFPVMGYNHSEIDTNIGSASITGGYFYRSRIDPCLYGRYLYMDLYGVGLWAGTENPENSGKFNTTRIQFKCAHDSPIQCSYKAGSPQPDVGYVFSFGEDNKKDVYILTSTGVYRIARPSRCNFTCLEQHFATPTPHSSSPKLLSGCKIIVLFLSVLLLILDDMSYVYG
ncbi:hypothetical protein Pint_15304 [Pistacia integerrima]|uniref:Uncharacterized protein n=1 Tax=Pistacia integerrima TaxID=434235 RepID=A0ACC0ZB10_9ROSI|nr:hypothetical protein Pint_15304 [Pistacia integerrima]